jgi:hypothetical protein
MRRATIKVLDSHTPTERITLKEAEDMLDSHWLNALTMGSPHVALLRCPTALGKTRLLERLGEVYQPHEYGHILIAAPNHKLKDEIADRLRGAGLPVVVTPRVYCPSLSVEEARAVDYLYTVGATELALNKLKTLSTKHPELARVLNEMNAARLNSTDILVTTHAQAILTNWGGQGTLAFGSREHYIFDEDPLSTLRGINEVSLAELHRLVDDLVATGRCPQSLGLVRQMIARVESNANLPTRVESFAVPPRELDKVARIVAKSSYTSNVLGLFGASAYCTKTHPITGLGEGLSYVVSRQLPDKQVTILSATASEHIYKRLLSSTRLGLYPIPPVEHVGRLVQFTDYSASRQSLMGAGAKVRSIIQDKLTELGIPPRNVITFKDCKTETWGHPEMHFGNTEGFDTLKGQDIAVVGMPYPNEAQTLLLAFSVGLLDGKHVHIFGEQQTLSRHGYEFKMWTYNDDDLREVQLWYIESNIQQAIGRARHLRCSSRVYLFAGLPHPDAEQSELRESAPLAQGNTQQDHDW